MISDSSQSDAAEDEELDEYGEQLLKAIKQFNTKTPNLRAIEKKI